MEGTAGAGLEVAQQGVDPAELRHFVGILAVGNDIFVVAVGCRHGAEAGQDTGNNLAAWREVAFGPVRNHL